MTTMMPGAWRCELHRLWTTGDCPDCAAEYFLDVDGYGEPTIWQRDADRPDFPQPMLRPCDIPPQGRHLWTKIVTALTEDPS